MALSERGVHSKESPAPLLVFGSRYLENPYNQHSNPQGIINLGMAESQLCEDILVQKLNEENVNKIEPYMINYTEWRGTNKFRNIIAEFLTERFKAPAPLDPDNVMCTSGAGAALDLLAHAFTNPGECFLTLAPIYSVIANDFGIRGQAKLHCIHLPGRKSPGKNAFTFDRKLLEDGLQEAKEKGEKVKGLVLTNPTNPTGDLYDANLIQEALQFCYEHDLHIILDEIYGLSVWDESCNFPSILSLTNIPDPNKTHFVWSFSKDFGLSGFRCGVIHTLNKEFFESTGRLCYFAAVPNPIQEQLGKMLQDKEWLDEVYFPANLSRMKESFQYVKKWCEKMGIYVHPATQAAYFIWADFSHYLSSLTAEAEMALCEEFFSEGVYIVPGTALFNREAGWFRITFTMQRDLLNKGLKRVEAVLRRNKSV